MSLSRKLLCWLGHPVGAVRPKLRLACHRLEDRLTPTSTVTTNTELLAVANSPQPIRDLQNVAAAFGLNASIDFARTQIVLTEGQSSLVQIGLTSTANAVTTLQTLSATGLYSSVSPNFVYNSSFGDLRERVPNDPLVGDQYFHTIIRTPQAWDTTVGTPGVVVAILDDGVSLVHPDLRNNVWSNPNEVPADGLDNDGNGFTDDINGWNFVENNNNVNPTDPIGDRHGTEVAGLLAAQIDNAIGVAGVAGGIRFLPLKVVGTGGGTTSLTLARAIGYAVQNGAKIINTSINVDPFADDPTYRAALSLAYDSGLLLVNSAGNQNIDNPPRTRLEELIVVSASDRNDVKADYSNYGSGIDITAPGGTADDGLLTTIPVSGYAAALGTSMAAPLVSGTAALVWSAFPNYTRDQVAAAVIANADSLVFKNPNFLDQLGSGRLNAARAVSGVKIVTGFGPLTGLPDEGSEAPASLSSFNLRLRSPLDPATVTTGNLELRWAGLDDRFGSADDKLIPLDINGGREYKIGTNDLTFGVNRSLERGLYRFTAKAGGIRDPFGNAVDGDGNGSTGGDLVRNFGIASQVRGEVYYDVRDDGFKNPTDPGEGGISVFADLNNNGQIDRDSFTATSGELIPDGGKNSIAIPVSGIAQVVGGLSIAVFVTHADPSELTMTLIAPDGTRVKLYDRRVLENFGPSNSHTFTFQDGIAEGTELIPTLSMHRVQPAEPLSALIGHVATGNWVVEVADAVPGNGGSLDAASITFASEPSAVTDPFGIFTFDGLPNTPVRFNILDTADWVRAANGGFVSLDLGTPQSSALSIGVTRPAGIGGRVLRDTGSGNFATALGIPEATVFLDRNFNSLFDLGEETATADEFGNYDFPSLSPGSYRPTLLVPPALAAIPGIPITQEVALTTSVPVVHGVDFLVQNNPAPAVAKLADVLPAFRNTPVDLATITLSEPTPGFGISSLTLTRDGQPLPLDGTTLLGSGTQFRILGLGSLTNSSGNYELRADAPAPMGQPNRKPALVTIRWTTDSDTPILNLTGIVQNNSVTGVTIASNEPLTGFTLDALSLTAGGKSISLAASNVVASDDGMSFVVQFPASAITVPNPVNVLLTGNGSGIRDAAGNEYTNSIGFAFQKPGGGISPGTVLSRTAVGADAGGDPVVNVYDTATGAFLVALSIFEQSFTGGIRVAAGDVNGDGVEDIIAAAGPGGGPRVRIIDGATFLNLADFSAFESTFTGGVFVSSGDFNGDGLADVVLSADRGGGPRVRILDVTHNATLLDFFGIDDPAFRGGARTGVGDVNGDGIPDLVVSAGFGGGPRIATFDGSRLASDQRKLTADYFAFDPALRNGAFLTVGDLNQDGFAEVIFGSGQGGGPRVLALSGKHLSTNGEQLAIADFFAGDPETRSGVRVVLKTSGPANSEMLLTSDGSGIGARVRGYTRASLANNPPNPAQEFEAFSNFNGGVFVG